MKHLQSFWLFETQTTSVLTPDQEEFLNECTHGTWSVNPETGLVDVSGNFVCDHRGLKTLLGISLGQVSGNFSCVDNQLTSLKGSPQTVNGDVICGNNQLTTLVGAPQKVNGFFLCHDNHLTSLVGAPQTVKTFNCYDNRLKTLEGGPQTVNLHFSCRLNRLTSLVGAPQTVGGLFECDSFELYPGKWNPSGWVEILTTGKPAAQKLMKTLPYLDPAYWLELHRSNRRKFNDIWMGYRQDPEVRKTALFQEVEAALSGRALKNLEDLQDLKDFGL